MSLLNIKSLFWPAIECALSRNIQTWHCVISSVKVLISCNRMFFCFSPAETVSEYVVRTRLIFPSVREQDTGTYRCAASNSDGSASSTATLQLIGRSAVVVM